MPYFSRFLTVGIVLVAQLCLAAQPDKKHNDVFTAGTAEENQIAREIRHKLLMLPYYGVFDDLAFRVDDGIVTLLGEVTRPTLKSDAENIAKRVEGVKNVVNDIEVLPASVMDDQLRVAVYRAIYLDSFLSSRYGYRALPSIHIIVKNGHVRLEGVVANEVDKDVANIRANGVPNVFSVTNDLQVESGK